MKNFCVFFWIVDPVKKSGNHYVEKPYMLNVWKNGSQIPYDLRPNQA